MIDIRLFSEFYFEEQGDKHDQSYSRSFPTPEITRFMLHHNIWRHSVSTKLNLASERQNECCSQGFPIRPFRFGNQLMPDLKPSTDEPVDAMPEVSVIMANYCGEAYLTAALNSVLAQTLRNIEVIVADDASADGSQALIRQFCTRDTRVQLITSEENQGPGAARNKALGRARGRWIAIVDSDDVIHPERLERLILTATCMQADAIADDLVLFTEAGADPNTSLLQSMAAKEAFFVTPEHFVRCNTEGSGLPPIGYLKPIFRHEMISGLRYDEDIRIGEDYEFLLKFLLGGGSYCIVPEALYLYRRHASSVSHRLSEHAVQAMIYSQHATEIQYGPFSTELEELLEQRLVALRRVVQFEHLVSLLKARRIPTAMALVMANLHLLPMLRRSAREHVQGRIKRLRKYQSPEPGLILLSETAPKDQTKRFCREMGLGIAYLYVGVPRYRVPAASMEDHEQSTALRVRLAQQNTKANCTLIAEGLAGMHALHFIPKVARAFVIITDQSEIDRALQWLPMAFAELILCDETRKRLPPAIETLSLGAGFHRVIRPQLKPTFIAAE